MAVESTVENKVIERSACGEIVLTAPLPADKEEEVTAAIKTSINTAKPGNKADVTILFQKLCQVEDIYSLIGIFEF